MNKIIFVDKNKKLVEKLKKRINKVKNNTHCELIFKNEDVFEVKKQNPKALLVTASNPEFQAGGGLDLALATKYPEQWKKAKEFNFTEDLFFVVSCDSNIQTNREIIRRALLGCYFASRKNDIIITGLGTNIGGLDIDIFINEYANFIDADFSNADFIDANFSNANFIDADFSNADFSNANFIDADFNYKIFPDEGNIIVWKKANQKIIKLEVNSKNCVGGLVGRKCRTNIAKVLSIEDINGEKANVDKIESDYDSNFIYEIGKTVEVKDWDNKPYLECTKGIHFFITREEACKW